MVPKIVCSLFTSHNFDHYANSHSLYRPQGAVVFLALPPASGKEDRLRIQHIVFLHKPKIAVNSEENTAKLVGFN